MGAGGQTRQEGEDGGVGYKGRDGVMLGVRKEGRERERGIGRGVNRAD